MKADKINYKPNFGARIMINKTNLVKTIGEQNLGLSTVCSGAGSSISASGFGVDAFAHQGSISVPESFFDKGIFNTLREHGHNLLNTFFKDNNHNAYDDSFFSSASGASIPYCSRLGQINLKKGFEEYTRSFPS